MKSVLILFLCVLPFISGKAIDSATSKCYVTYLKNHGFLGAKKLKVTPLSSECVSIVEEGRNAAIEKTRKKFKADEDIKEKADCIVEKLNKTEFFDRKLIQELDFTKAKIGKDGAELSDIFGSLSDLLQILRSMGSCDIDDAFDDDFKAEIKSDFESFFENDEDADEVDENIDYCVRKHMIDNNLITYNQELFKVNPKNIDTSDVDCDALYQQFVKETEEYLAEAFQDEEEEEAEESDDPEEKTWRKCFQKYTHQKGTIDQMLQFDYVQEFGLTPEQKDKLGDEFVRVMTIVTKTALNCLI